MKNVKAITFSFFLLIGYVVGLLHRGFSTQYDDGFGASIGLMVAGVGLIIVAVALYFTNKIKKKPKEPTDVGHVNKLDLHKEFTFK